LNGRSRLLELLGPNVEVSVKPSVPPGSLALSFVGVLVPLLTVLTCDAIHKSVRTEAVNTLYAGLRAMGGLELRLARLFDQWTTQGGGSGRHTEAPREVGGGRGALVAKSWVDAALPIARLLHEMVNRLTGAHASPDMQQAVEVLRQAVTRCMAQWPQEKEAQGMLRLERAMRTVELRVRAAQGLLTVGAERAERREESRRQASNGLLGGLFGAKAGTSVYAFLSHAAAFLLY
jgi:hypothetical protein